jgi:hypothetical protein
MVRTDTQLTKQVGEYLVAAELARRGLISATFAGSVRHYDIIASGSTGGHVPVQVKTINRGSWQLNFGNFVNVTMKGNRQILGAAKDIPYMGLVFVFVKLQAYGSDQFYILDWKTLRDLLRQNYSAYLEKHGGRRPKNPKTLHTALTLTDLSPYRDRWDVITNSVKQAA